MKLVGSGYDVMCLKTLFHHSPGDMPKDRQPQNATQRLSEQRGMLRVKWPRLNGALRCPE